MAFEPNGAAHRGRKDLGSDCLELVYHLFE